MSFALDKPVFMSREEFYRWCAGQPEGRYERVDGELIAMSPERFGHARTKQAIFLALLTAMAQTRSVCEVFIDSVAVRSGESDYLPDVLINCGKPPDAEQMVAPNPVGHRRRTLPEHVSGRYGWQASCLLPHPIGRALPDRSSHAAAGDPSCTWRWTDQYAHPGKW